MGYFSTYYFEHIEMFEDYLKEYLLFIICDRDSVLFSIRNGV